MYSSDVIETLSKRIRWNESLEAESPIELDDTNKIGDSGKHFQSFHQLVTIDNIAAAVPDPEMENGKFNEMLTDMRKQATLQAVSDIMDANPKYVAETDYSEVMKVNAAAFDNAIGYKVALSVIEMFLTSSRSNLVERNAKMAVQVLKIELEGLTENGVTRAKGLKKHYLDAVSKASGKLFPNEIIVKSISAW